MTTGAFVSLAITRKLKGRIPAITGIAFEHLTAEMKTARNDGRHTPSSTICTRNLLLNILSELRRRLTSFLNLSHSPSNQPAFWAVRPSPTLKDLFQQH